MGDSNYYKEIINKLEKLTKKEYILFALLGIQISFLVGVVIFTLFVFLEMLGHFSSTVRTVLFFIFLVLFIGTFLYLIISISLEKQIITKLQIKSARISHL